MNRIIRRILMLAMVAGTFMPRNLRADDPGKADLVLMDSVTVKAGQSTVVGLGIQADDTTSFNGRTWQGVGSFCIPLKYDQRAFKVDSARFVGTLAQWDEKFSNPRKDTGFISFAGIYDLTGKGKPVLFAPARPEQVILIFLTAATDIEPGVYRFKLTSDPIQKEIFLGSPDGVHSWRPQFASGKIVIQ
jgi:hypothetical protein